ncbi:hypothetical protein XENOCAPTIV_020387 [Xenoophorus captivus]|uniref:Uncharacterized protein n=1 Tax=Xenoophorus captivus TaxID=1517983 RepID=A0ABV0SGA2_9TELE
MNTRVAMLKLIQISVQLWMLTEVVVYLAAAKVEMTSYNLQPALQDAPLQREAQSSAERSSSVNDRDHHPKEMNSDSMASVKGKRSISNKDEYKTACYYLDQYTPVSLPAEEELGYGGSILTKLKIKAEIYIFL